MFGLLAAAAAVWVLLVATGTVLAERAQDQSRSSQRGNTVPNDATARLIAVVDAQPDYVMGFIADFGGDPEEYIPVQDPRDIDFAKITPAQTGMAFRQFIETVPPRGLPADLNLADVNWATVGSHIERTASFPGGM